MLYTNPNGQAVTATYRGLRDLNVIHGELEHGTEIIYEKRTGTTEGELIHYDIEERGVRSIQRDRKLMAVFYSKGRMDVVVAIFVGFGLEISLTVWLFMASGDLTLNHRWLNILQMPGSEIALLLFDRGGPLQGWLGRLPAITFIVVVQAFLYSTVILGAIYLFRVVSARLRVMERDGPVP